MQICYAPALREETARRNLFANAMALTRATRGKGIIISSSARSAFELRGPYDVINMATLFGLSEQDAKVTFQCVNLVCQPAKRQVDFVAEGNITMAVTIADSCISHAMHSSILPLDVTECC